MARKLRIQYPGAIYHVMNRGDRREEMVRDDLDRHQWLKTLGEALWEDGLASPCLLLDEQSLSFGGRNAASNLVDGAAAQRRPGENKNCQTAADGDNDELGLNCRALEDGSRRLRGKLCEGGQMNGDILLCGTDPDIMELTVQDFAR